MTGPEIFSAFEKAAGDRRHVIVAAVTLGTCCALPTLSLLNDGYAVHPVVDACGAWNRYEAEAAMSRMAAAGAELATTFALACELQADWKLPTASAMFEPFVRNLPEHGFPTQNFWNNANGRTVPDPFGMVKWARPRSCPAEPRRGLRRAGGRAHRSSMEIREMALQTTPSRAGTLARCLPVGPDPRRSLHRMPCGAPSPWEARRR